MDLSEKLKEEGKIDKDFNYELLKWSQFKHLEVEKMFDVVAQKVFPFIKLMGGEESSFTAEMKDAVFMVPKPSLLQESVRLIDGINMDDSDTKGDLYEYFLSKFATSGINGQFRTPRHIIRMMVELMDPSSENKVCDPACGTAGFLINSLEYLLEKYTNPESVFTDEEGNLHNRIGDMMSTEEWEHFRCEMFYGFDFDSSMNEVKAMKFLCPPIELQNQFAAFVNQVDKLKFIRSKKQKAPCHKGWGEFAGENIKL